VAKKRKTHLLVLMVKMNRKTKLKQKYIYQIYYYLKKKSKVGGFGHPNEGVASKPPQTLWEWRPSHPRTLGMIQPPPPQFWVTNPRTLMHVVVGKKYILKFGRK
jgi:hypothetical protein